jgi:hypothetical protein
MKIDLIKTFRYEVEIEIKNPIFHDIKSKKSY